MGDTTISNKPLEALLASGTVRGVCLLKDGDVSYENFPYSAARLVKVCRVVEGLTKEFKAQGRVVDQMAFGYDGGNLLAVSMENYRLIFMHLMSDEIDFLAKAARAHMADLIAADEPEPVTAKVSDAVSLDTVPISLAKDREVSREKVDETARVEILATPAPSAVAEQGSGLAGVSAEDMSVEDLVGYYSAQDDRG
ncbi:MAG: hypothetical protein L3J39_04030 [Verrucomicrobiales bacterium]|nr:hypothetical protein [Verrucomicrobiales bacterium]